MKVVALVSGGKDSCFNMMHCVAEGHEIVALANLCPPITDEMDSYMYQTVGHHAIEAYGEAMGLPLFREFITGSAINQGKDYQEEKGDEVEDLYRLLKKVQENIHFDGVSVGAILSDYQRVRVENVCTRLNVTSLAYLWRRDQSELLTEMVDCGLDVIIIKIAALGLTPQKFLGKSLQDVKDDLFILRDKYGINPCGEGGEYETFTIDCPLFKKAIKIKTTETVFHSEDDIAPVVYLNIKDVSLEEKKNDQRDPLANIPLKRSSDFVENIIKKCPQVPLPATSDNQLLSNCVHKSNFAINRTGHISSSADGSFTVVAWCGREGEALGNVEEYMQEVLSNVRSLLSSAGASLEDVASVNLYVQKMSDFSRINNVYKKLFDLNPPVRACVEIPLPSNVPLVLDCFGLKKPRESLSDGEISLPESNRRTMHVQGISHWAPANIGPYSQSVLCPIDQEDGTIYVAGQIGLVPGSMTLISGGAWSECSLSLRHVGKILAATCNSSGPRCIELAICYVTNSNVVSSVRDEWKQFIKKREVLGDDIVSAEDVSPLMEVVVVSNLPRGALVEWQVYASPSPKEHSVIERSVLKGSVKATCKCQRRRSIDKPVASLLCKAGSHDGNVCDVQDLIESAVECIQKCLTEGMDEISTSNFLWNFRAFYNCTKVNGDDIMAAFEDHNPNNSWCITFVPVLGHQDEQCVLSVCH